MILEIDVSLDYALPTPASLLLAIEVAEAAGQRVHEAALDLGGAEARLIPGSDGFGARRWIRAEDALRARYRARVEVTRPRPDLSTLRGVPPHELDGPATDGLMASRYCAADAFQPFVGSEFAGLAGGALVQAIRDWTERSLSYVPGSSDATTTAADTFLTRQGICRDYAHVVIAMCRAGGVPARMASVYAPHVEPPDFHAVAEAWLDGAWHLVDATGMAGADEIALVGVGRDAAEAAFLTSYGAMELRSQTVKCRAAG